jgi:ABC-2 type transport system ATP-binding protein
VSPPDPGPALLIEGLYKSFRIRRTGLSRTRRIPLPVRRSEDVPVLRGVDLTVPHGCVYGYIGRNGAGKTTTLRTVAGVLHPDRGRVLVYGRPPHRDPAAKHDLGVVFGQRSQLWPDLSARVGYDILADIYAIPATQLRRTLAELDDVFGISEYWHRPVRHLSLGQRMQCDLVAAVLHRPRLLILDEPTIGMDTAARSAFRELINHLRTDRRCTVVLTTHDMGELERMCDRLAILENGRVTFEGTLADLHERVTVPVTVTIHLAGPAPAELPWLPSATLVDRQPGSVVYQVPTRGEVPKLFQVLAAAVDIAEISIAEASLEDLVRAL